MPYKNKELQKKYQREWYQKNKLKCIERSKTIRDSRRKYVTDIKKKSKCKICGYSDYRALVFHHRDPLKKEDTITHMARNSVSMERLDREIDKCDILCSNCHMLFHFEDNKNKIMEL